jgi:putative transcriptional regulator
METGVMTEDSILREIGERLRRERLNRNLTQAVLAERAGVSRIVVQRLEQGAGSTLGGLIAVLRAMGLLGQLDAFLPDPGPSPIQLARLQGRTRERATGRRGGARG